MSKFNNAEKYAIQNKIGNGETVEEVASFLHRSPTDINEYLNELNEAFERLNKNNVDTKIKAQIDIPSIHDRESQITDDLTDKVKEVVEEYVPELEREVRDEEKPRTVNAVPEGLTKKLMVNRTAGKNEKGVSIMTPGAASVSDDAAKNHRAGTRSRTSKGALFDIEKKEII